MEAWRSERSQCVLEMEDGSMAAAWDAGGAGGGNGEMMRGGEVGGNPGSGPAFCTVRGAKAF